MYRFEVYFLEDILTHPMQKMQFITVPMWTLMIS